MKTPTSSLFSFNRQWSARVFTENRAMTIDEFVAYAEEELFGEHLEGMYENISQCQSEINMFGDSGPGTMLRLREQIAEFNKIADRLTALTGRTVQRPRLPYHPASSNDEWCRTS